MEWDVVIGLEAHAQLKTSTKLFCSCAVEFGSAPNARTCPVCLGMPGVLPVINRHAVELAIRAALGAHCEIQTDSTFARKNYFYPDLPKGYQVSQYEKPLALGGWIDIQVGDRTKRAFLERIHMEEDAGKLVHGAGAFEDARESLVDLNRAGVPLIEIVGKPDLTSPEEAGAYLRALRSLIVYLGVSGADMEKGELRCDANVSLKPKGAEKLGTKVELKNINSFRFVEKALEYEIARQRDVLEDGGTLIQETRLYNSDKGVTFSMRTKEHAHDYRYFPDPDLIPLRFPSAWIEEIRGTLAETGAQKSERYVTAWSLSAYDAAVLTADPDVAHFFERTVEAGADPKLAANWIMGDLLGALKKEGVELRSVRITPAELGALIALITDGTISGKIAKQVFGVMFEEGGEPAAIVKAKGLVQITDTGALEKVIDEILAANPGQLAEFRAGKEQLRGFFVGQIMKKTQGKANPQVVSDLLSARIK